MRTFNLKKRRLEKKARTNSDFQKAQVTKLVLFCSGWQNKSQWGSKGETN